MRKEIAEFVVNGRPYEAIIEAHMTLLDVLRDQLHFLGVKYGCGTGDCGACTVLVEDKPMCSCLTLAITVKGKNITTVEGLTKGVLLHPIQKAFIDCGAVQCGFCTPGMILMAKSFLDRSQFPTREEVEAALAGNLCRCTGYVKITDAVLAAAETIRRG
jgi:carbon-monoxide dehydrogenase small subunit